MIDFYIYFFQKHLSNVTFTFDFHFSPKISKKNFSRIFIPFSSDFQEEKNAKKNDKSQVLKDVTVGNFSIN